MTMSAGYGSIDERTLFVSGSMGTKLGMIDKAVTVVFGRELWHAGVNLSWVPMSQTGFALVRRVEAPSASP